MTDEALRYEPITPFTARVTTRRVSTAASPSRRTRSILVSSWHANRDGVENPDAFDITIQRDGRAC